MCAKVISLRERVVRNQPLDKIFSKRFSFAPNQQGDFYLQFVYK